MERPPPSCSLLPCSAGAIALWDWSTAVAAAPPAATVVLLHAAGFHSRCWDEVIRCLPTTYRCICIDVPGHGLSSALPEVSWRVAGQEVILALSDPSIAVDRVSVLVGHSMGGYISAAVAAMMPGRCSALLLIDPVIMPAELYADRSPGAARLGELMRESASKRKAEFGSAEEMVERFKDRFPYATWHPRALRDYCNYGLGQPGPDGARPLLCKPAVEGANYMYGNSPDADLSAELVMLAERGQRAVVLRVPRDPEGVPFRGSPTDPMLAKRLGANTTDVVLDGVNHFIPMMKPDVVAQYIERLASELSLAHL